MPNLIDLTGQTFGRWTVTGRTGSTAFGAAKWACVCECGNKKNIGSQTLRTGGSKSCGCYNVDVHREICIVRNTSHGMARSDEHNTWVNMRQRCENPNNNGYHKYGARGITVCERWKSFEHFFADMGKRPTKKHSIDRINSLNGYSPDNCRWATAKQQQNNRTNNLKITYLGETLTAPDWSKKYGMSIETIRQRLKRGLPMEKVFSKQNLRWA